MNRFLFFLITIFLFVFLPLIGDFTLLSDQRVLYTILAICILNFTQPSLKEREAEKNKKGDKNTVMLIVFATGLSVSIPIIDWAYFSHHTIDNLFFSIGIIVNLAGLFFRAWSIRILGRHFTATVQIKDDHLLIQKGPYKVVRHPSYTGALVAILGISIIFQSWIGLISCVFLMGYAYYNRISAEEEELGHYFGNSYQEYSKRTYRMIPFIW